MHNSIDFSQLARLVKNLDGEFWNVLFEFNFWGVSCFIREGRTMLRFRFRGSGFDLAMPVLIDLVCDGVTESDVDWRIIDVLEVWGEESDGKVLVNIKDNLTRYVSQVKCAKAWIEVVTAGDVPDKFDYTIALRVKSEYFEQDDEADGEDQEPGIEDERTDEELQMVSTIDFVITDKEDRFIDRYFGD